MASKRNWIELNEYRLMIHWLRWRVTNRSTKNHTIALVG